MKVGFLGPKGTFSEEAMLEYVKDKEYTAHGYNTIPDMLFAVRDSKVDEAVVPIENSLEGAVSATLDMMAFEVDLKIKAEFVRAIRQNLLVRKGTKLSDIKYIFTHPQPVGQCGKFLRGALPDAEIRLVYSTAGAAEEVAHGDGRSAAIGSLAAAKAFNLDVLVKDIHDIENNSTRFIVIARDDSERTGLDKTSIVFSTENKPGSLYRVLDIFNLWDINMTRIESRPAKNELGKYVFFVDIMGHREDEDVRNALTMVKRKTSFFKFLGSYPMWRG